MRFLGSSAVVVLAVLCAGCFQMTTQLKVKADGSGTIDHRMIYSTKALAQMRGLASLGPGVTYVTSSPIETADSKGRVATYAFNDVTTLRVSTQPAAPAGVSIRAGGVSTESDSVTFSLERLASGNSMLHIHVPEPGFLDTLSSPQASGQIGMVKQLLGGAKVLLTAEADGTLVKTSSPYVEGARVTLLEIDLDEILKDETIVPRLQAAKTREEGKQILSSAKGLKINWDRDITIEFTPAK